LRASGGRTATPIPALIEAFSWEACGRGDGKFDPKKFLAIEHEHLKNPALTPDDEYKARVKPFLAKRGIDRVDDERLTRAITTVRERAATFFDAANAMDFYFRAEPVMDDKAVAKFLVPANAQHLAGLEGALRDVTDWSVKELEERVTAWLTAQGLLIKDVAQPARVALTGRTASPGLYEVLEVLGREDSLARLARGRALAESRSPS
jgi:glutamyl-tRNA synthetase